MKKIFFLFLLFFSQTVFSQTKYYISFAENNFGIIELFPESIYVHSENFKGINGITAKNIYSALNVKTDTAALKYFASEYNYKSSLISFSDGNKWAVFNYKGKKLTDYKYDFAFPFLPENNDAVNIDSSFCFVSVGGKWNLVDATGKEIDSAGFSLPYINDISPTTHDFYFPESTTPACDFSTARCDIHLLDQGIFEIPMMGVNLVVIKNGKYGAMDLTGRETIPFIYDEIITNKNGYHRALRNGKWGFLDDTGQEVIECKYDLVYDYKLTEVVNPKTEEYYKMLTAKVILKKKTFLIDINGALVEMEE